MIGRGRYGWWGWALREVAIDGAAGGEFFENRSAFVFGIYVGPNINTIMLASMLCWLQKYFREFPKEFATSLLTKPT